MNADKNVVQHEEEEVDQCALTQLQWSLQALAQPAGVQLSLFPEIACAGDELASDFRYWLARYRMEGDALTQRQATSLDRLDEYLELLDSDADRALWGDEALEGAVEWRIVRLLSQRALDDLHWSMDEPSAERPLCGCPDG